MVSCIFSFSFSVFQQNNKKQTKQNKTKKRKKKLSLPNLDSIVGFLSWLATSHSYCSHSLTPTKLRLLFPTAAQKSSFEVVCPTSAKNCFLPSGWCCSANTAYLGLQHLFHTSELSNKFKCRNHCLIQQDFNGLICWLARKTLIRYVLKLECLGKKKTTSISFGQ